MRCPSNLRLYPLITASLQIFFSKRNILYSQCRLIFCEKQYTFSSHWIALYNINCVHLCTGSFFKFNGLHINHDQFYWYRVSGPLYFCAILLVAGTVWAKCMKGMYMICIHHCILMMKANNFVVILSLIVYFREGATLRAT